MVKEPESRSQEATRRGPARRLPRVTGQMEINASEFKAKCLALIDRVHTEGLTIVIRKRGKDRRQISN